MTARATTTEALANLLWDAQRALTRYRQHAAGFQRLALSDLATFDELQSQAADQEAIEDPEEWARDVMALFIASGLQPSLGGPDRHFADAVYEGHADEVHDALEKLGLLAEEESDG